MPFQYKCVKCNIDFVAKQKTRKYCSNKCNGDVNRDRLIAANIARTKYERVDGLSYAQAAYRGRNGIDSLRDIKKRHDLLSFLGGKCVECGYDKDLRGMVLDHIQGDGYEDRKRLGTKIARYYINNLDEAKIKLQVLCATCNQIKSMEKKEHNRSRRIIKE
jgi:hypothetical protein